MSCGEAWSGIQIGDGAADGDLKQLYPTWVAAGVIPPWHAGSTATPGQTVRRPMQGELLSLQVETDDATGGIIEIWDVNGEDGGINVSSLDVITDAQLLALKARGKAKLLYSQNFASSAGAASPAAVNRTFSKGLAARLVVETPGSGYCNLNLVVNGGFQRVQTAGV